MDESVKTVEELIPPVEFCKIIDDFTNDIITTFPEYSGIISKWWNRPSDNMEETKKNETLIVFRHCVKIFPERFFDILYKNQDMFNDESEIRTDFLPGVVFKQLWTCDISDKTRDTIWKYLQLTGVAIIGSVHNKEGFGDAAKLLESINEGELQSKLQETLEGMQHMFSNTSSSDSNTTCNDDPSNAQYIDEHINSMMDGKLGKLAMELAEKTATDLNLDTENTGNANDVFQQLIKNPTKMMSMVSTIGSQIDSKIKSGEINENELMQEGMEMLGKMKNMPGMGDMQKMFSQMGMGGIPGLGKESKSNFNMNDITSQMNKSMQGTTAKERLRAKVDARAREQSQTAFRNMSNITNTIQQDSVPRQDSVPQQDSAPQQDSVPVFSTGETVEKTLRGAKPPNQASKKKKKKGHK